MRLRGRLKTLAAYAAVFALVCVTSSAAAEYRHRVLLLERTTSGDSDHEITTRVRAELGAAGFEVLVLPVTEEDPKAAVESAGRELHPASVLLVERIMAGSGDKQHSGGAELWLADRMLRKTVVLRLKGEDAAAPGGDSAAGNSREAARVAVQAVELVRVVAEQPRPVGVGPPRGRLEDDADPPVAGDRDVRLEVAPQRLAATVAGQQVVGGEVRQVADYCLRRIEKFRGQLPVCDDHQSNHDSLVMSRWRTRVVTLFRSFISRVSASARYTDR